MHTDVLMCVRAGVRFVFLTSFTLLDSCFYQFLFSLDMFLFLTILFDFYTKENSVCVCVCALLSPLLLAAQIVANLPLEEVYVF